MNAPRSNSLLRPSYIPNPEPIQSENTPLIVQNVWTAIACLTFFPVLYLLGSFVAAIF